MSSGLRSLDAKYEVIEKLSEGGMGAIYKVRHRNLDTIRVIKMMRPQHENDPELRERFLREARAATLLRHPNIAEIFDFMIDDDGTSYMEIEFIRGFNCRELLASRGRFPVDLALQAAKHALRALGYLHRRNFIHRDVSPDNLMLTRDVDGRALIKLIDLGIAKRLQAARGLTSTGTFLGKIHYASPEQFGGARREDDAAVDHRSDLYSFGIVLYELLTARYPMFGKDYRTIINSHLFRQPLAFDDSDPEGRVGPELRQAVLRALAKERADRFANAEEFAQALERLPAAAGAAAAGPAAPSDPAWDLETILPLEDVHEARRDRPAPVVAPLPMDAVRTEIVTGLEDPARAIRKAAEHIDALLRSGHLRAASLTLMAATTQYGEDPTLGGLRRRIDESKTRTAELLASADQLVRAGDLAGAESRLEELALIDRDSGKAARLAQQIRRGRDEARRPPPPPPAPAPPRPGDAGVVAPAAGAAAAASPETGAAAAALATAAAGGMEKTLAMTAAAAARKRRRATPPDAAPTAALDAAAAAGLATSWKRAWIIAAAAAALLLPAALLVRSWMAAPALPPGAAVPAARQASAAAAAITPPTTGRAAAPQPPSPPARLARVRVDALPWARVVRVTGAGGRAFATGGSDVTPLVLELPAGSYSILLRGPDDQARTIVVEVDATGAAKPALVDFAKVDADAYLRAAGL